MQTVRRNIKIWNCIYSAGLETVYDQLQRGDINSPSVYQTLGAQQASKDFKDHKGYFASVESFSWLFFKENKIEHIFQLLHFDMHLRKAENSTGNWNRNVFKKLKVVALRQAVN